MNSRPPAPEIMPNRLVQQLLFDKVASDPVACLVFLAAARALVLPEPAQDLGMAFTQPKESRDGWRVFEICRYGRYEPISNRLSMLSGTYGYFRTIDRGLNHFALHPHFVSYKLQLVTALIDARLAHPEAPMSDLLGTARSRQSLSPGTPSISLGLLRMIVDRHNPAQPLRLTHDLLRWYDLEHTTEQNVSSRTTFLDKKGLIKKGPDGIRLRADLVPFATDLVQRVGALTVGRIYNPQTNRDVAQRADAILKDSDAVQWLLSTIKKGSRTKRLASIPNMEERSSRPSQDTEQIDPAQSVVSRLAITPGTYPADWITRGRCQEARVSLSLFVIDPAIDPSEPELLKQIKRAQKYCQSCEVRGPCLRAALLAEDTSSIAALPPAERAALTEAEKRTIIDSITIYPIVPPRKTS